jgi:hypothetical protein
MNENETLAAQEQVAAPVTVAKTKATGNLIHDVAVEIENLTKTKALHQADKLAEDIEANYFKLGGVLKLINGQQWFEGFASFDAFVLEKFGFQVRKAHYLIQIYTNLVGQQIPWEKVAGLGWTKLKDLAPILTLENLDEWVAKAANVTVAELQAMIKASQGGGSTESGTTTSDNVVLKFKMHNDQAEAVNTALAKAKGELSTDFDNVALAGICTGYLANASGVASTDAMPADLKAVFLAMGYEEVLQYFDAAFPLIDLSVDPTKHEESLSA